MNEIIKMTDEEYFKIPALSNSFLIQFDRSPLHSLTVRKATNAMSDGSMSHAFLLDSFYDKYIVAPFGIDNKVCKEFKEFKRNNTEKDIILYKDYEILSKIKENVDKYEIIDGLTYKQISDKSQKEIAVFKEEIIDGVNIQKKAKPDLLFEGDEYNIIIDLKKTENCLRFLYSIRDLKYYRQAAWYIDLVTSITNKKTIFIFLTFEMDSPHGVKAYMIDDEYIRLGNVENLSSVLKWIDWKNKGSLPLLYKEGIEIIEKPKYL